MKILNASSPNFLGNRLLGANYYALKFANDGWQVAYISNPLSPFNTIFGKDKKYILKLLKNHIKNGVYINNNLWYYVPFTFIPFHKNTIFDQSWFIDNYYRFTVPSIKSIIENKEFSSVDVLWLGDSCQEFWLNILKYKCCIYRLGDNTKEFCQASKTLLKAEENIIKHSDFILVSSKVLLQEYAHRFINQEFIYCPNGVCLTNFIRNRYYKPKEFTNINTRIALYVGAIDCWFDWELLINIAKKCPEISFFIIGNDRLGNFKKTSENIYYLGPKKYTEIPNYIYYCDCGIIPFNTSNLVQTISPIKMYEFFSLGKPVISRVWEELKLLDAPCFLADNEAEFVDILKDNNTFSISSKKLVDYALENTWDKRYIQILKVINGVVPIETDNNKSSP